ncbi:MAG: hypothetical protein U5K33_10305 [Halofilum sp. (in: g-proteobacteria)]|nr:hypothetical protein [Halofilum sp. (in: g-proteobacteria)]
MVRFGFLGISYNTDLLSETDAQSYRLFWKTGLKGKVGHFDWHLPNLGQISLLNGNPEPYNLDETAWRKLQETTMSLRPQVAGFFDYAALLPRRSRPAKCTPCAASGLDHGRPESESVHRSPRSCRK